MSTILRSFLNFIDAKVNRRKIGFFSVEKQNLAARGGNNA